MKELREHLLWLLRCGQAHIGFDDAVSDLPFELLGSSVEGLPHTPWRLVEHMRIAQWDILEFSRNADHVSPEFPDGYWPDRDTPSELSDWFACLDRFRRDASEFQQLVADPNQSLLDPFPWGDGQTLLREALLIADHNAYHLGQLIAVRKALGA